ncbi:MAG: (2Fe-2S)-binding protein [Gaiella sp.]|nr:(2Fe-2S)-binding protein [Gaiella sp.]
MPTTSRPASDLRLPGGGAAVTISVDGSPVVAREGEPILAALWAAGIRALHTTAQREEPRAFFCGIGICFDCLVTIDGESNLRACMTPVAPGMSIETQRDPGWQGFAHA